MTPERLDEIAQLRAELTAYTESRLYDACMSGAVFKGWDRSALDRARKITENRILREDLEMRRLSPLRALTN